MRLVFCGTPEFAVPTLAAVLAAAHEVALVLTQPDKPVGRKQDVQMPAVKAFALAHGLRVEQPERIKNNADLRATLEELQPEAILVVAYGRIIPQWMLDLPRFGNLNLHGSLLPKYRGAAPIQWAIANGESETGVTTMRLDAGLDTGDVLLEHVLPVGADETAAHLYPKLAAIGAGLVLETLRGLDDGTLGGRAQDHAAATLAPILTREDGRLDLARTAGQTYNRWRGFSPWPGCYGEFRGKRFLLLTLRQAESDLPDGLAPGALLLHGGELLLGVAQNTALRLDEVQLEGKARMSGAAFYRDFQVKSGERVG